MVTLLILLMDTMSLNKELKRDLGRSSVRIKSLVLLLVNDDYDDDDDDDDDSNTGNNKRMEDGGGTKGR